MTEEITVDNMTEEQYLNYDEMISDGFTEDQALIYIEGMING